MGMEYTDNIEEIVTFGHDKVDPKETVEVNLKDLLYVYSTLQEYVRFFHQPMHYPSLEDVEEFLGGRDEPKGIKVLFESVYVKMREMFPSNIEEMFNDGKFDSPKCPFYFKEKN